MAKNIPTKKVYVFIFEGWSDKSAIEGILSRIYANRKIVPVVTYGDITSNEDLKISNLEDIIYKKVKKAIEEDKIKISDVMNIVQICDTDGTFISDDKIQMGQSEDLIYKLECIEARSIEKVVKRNSHKSKAMNHLLLVNSIKSEFYT